MSNENSKPKVTVHINMRKEGDAYVPDEVEVRGGNYYDLMAASGLPTLDEVSRAYGEAAHLSALETSTAIRVPEGQDPNAYEMRGGMKVYRREVVDLRTGKKRDVYVPESFLNC